MPRNAVAYDDDFFEWAMEQARLLRAGNLSEIDALNLAEEIESMGRSDRRELENRLVVLLAHLLKWKVLVQFRSRSWSGTIKEQRAQIEEVLADSPSLRRIAQQLKPTTYRRARQNAASETGLADRMFPAQCPFTPEQILSPDFLPED